MKLKIYKSFYSIFGYRNPIFSVINDMFPNTSNNTSKRHCLYYIKLNKIYYGTF